MPDSLSWRNTRSSLLKEQPFSGYSGRDEPHKDNHVKQIADSADYTIAGSVHRSGNNKR